MSVLAYLNWPEVDEALVRVDSSLITWRHVLCRDKTVFQQEFLLKRGKRGKRWERVISRGAGKGSSLIFGDLTHS